MEEKHVGEIGGMELGIAAGFAGAIVTVVISIATLAYWMGGKFAEIDARFGGIERGMEGISLGLFGKPQGGHGLKRAD